MLKRNMLLVWTVLCAPSAFAIDDDDLPRNVTVKPITCEISHSDKTAVWWRPWAAAAAKFQDTTAAWIGLGPEGVRGGSFRSCEDFGGTAFYENTFSLAAETCLNIEALVDDIGVIQISPIKGQSVDENAVFRKSTVEAAYNSWRQCFKAGNYKVLISHGNGNPTSPAALVFAARTEKENKVVSHTSKTGWKGYWVPERLKFDDVDNGSEDKLEDFTEHSDAATLNCVIPNTSKPEQWWKPLKAECEKMLDQQASWISTQQGCAALTNVALYTSSITLNDKSCVSIEGIEDNGGRVLLWSRKTKKFVFRKKVMGSQYFKWNTCVAPGAYDIIVEHRDSGGASGALVSFKDEKGNVLKHTDSTWQAYSHD